MFGPADHVTPGSAKSNQEVVDSSNAPAAVMVNLINQAPAANNPVADRIKALGKSLEHDNNNHRDQTMNESHDIVDNINHENDKSTTTTTAATVTITRAITTTGSTTSTTTTTTTSTTP